MPGGSKPYQQGYRYEVKEREYWEDKGYWTLRRRGSKGPFDVLAIAPDGSHAYLIEVKSFSNLPLRKSYQADIENLKGIPTGPNIRTLLAVWGPIKRGVSTPRAEIDVTTDVTRYDHEVLSD